MRHCGMMLSEGTGPVHGSFRTTQRWSEGLYGGAYAACCSLKEYFIHWMLGTCLPCAMNSFSEISVPVN